MNAFANNFSEAMTATETLATAAMRLNRYQFC